jgi:hypothetical protein
MGMTKPNTALLKALWPQERVLLFCLGSETDWKEAGVTLKTVAGLVGKSFSVVPMPLVQPMSLVRWVMPSQRLALTDAGRAALRAMLRDL